MINLKGILFDAANKPISGAKILLRSVKNGSVPTGIIAEVITDEKGEYDFNANVGSYLCYILVENTETALPGYVNIYDYSGEGTLQEYLYAPCEKDARPMFIFMWEIIRQEINSSLRENRDIEARIIELKKEVEAMYEIAADGGNVIFKTVPEGMAATSDGGYFRVESQLGGETLFTWYRKSGSIAVMLGGVPSTESINSIRRLIADLDDSEFVLKIVNGLGHKLFSVSANEDIGTKNVKITRTGLTTPGVSMNDVPGKGGIYSADMLGRSIALFDEKGFARAGKISGDSADLFIDGTQNVLSVVDPLGRGKVIIKDEIKQGGGNVDEISMSISRIDSICEAYSENVKSQYNPNIARFIFEICHILWYGQSLSTNQEGFPALTKLINEHFDNYMIGESSRPSTRGGADYTPVGGLKVLNHLKAVTQSEDGSKVLTQEEENALTYGKGNEGEGGVACVNFIKLMLLDSMSMASNPNRKFVLSNCGVNGRTIEQLSKGASPEIYNRARQAVKIVKDIAAENNSSYGIPCVFHSQGEWNYWQMNNGTNDKQAFIDKTQKVFDDFTADFCRDQSRPPAFFIYQTGASYTRDDKDMSIGMAQLEMAKAGKGVYGTYPAYAMPDKGGHLTSNGYRWADMFHAKVAFKVMILGEGWEPLHIIHGEIKGNTGLYGYHVPAPPLRFNDVLVQRALTMYPNRGFRATDGGDSNNPLPINSVEIVSPRVIKIEYARKPTGVVKLWYADKTEHNGNGNLQDSDKFKSMYNYEFIEGSSQTADENIPSLVGKPYPLNNWAFAQVFKVGV